MLETVLQSIHNFFVRETLPEAVYTIADSALDIPGTVPGQYVRIIGSVLNDGVHQVPLSGLSDETFTGYVQLLAIPPAFLSLVEEIAAWTQENKPTAFTSESFGGYSYSKATGANGVAADWQDVFRARLNPYRKTAQH